LVSPFIHPKNSLCTRNHESSVEISSPTRFSLTSLLQKVGLETFHKSRYENLIEIQHETAILRRINRKLSYSAEVQVLVKAHSIGNSCRFSGLKESTKTL
jgi:hypothetical protein